MTEENKELKQDVVEISTENNEVTTNTNTDTATDKVDVVKPTRNRRTKKQDVPTVEPTTENVITVEVENTNTELEDLKKQLEILQAQKLELENEKQSLNEKVTKLQQEVKITPQKLGLAIKQMGVTPMSMGRENSDQMTLESYNSMTDTARREWQRTHRSEYLTMLHNVKLHNYTK